MTYKNEGMGTILTRIKDDGNIMGLFGCDYLEIIGTFLPEYRCKYSRQILMPHTAQDICMSRRYMDCADFKNASRCFITTAVCLTLGKSDNCEELSAMRWLRDGWLRNQPEGQILIENYYEVAPEIVASIDRKKDRLAVYETIYRKYILPCVEKVRAKEFAEGARIYMQMVNTLEKQYGQNNIHTVIPKSI